MNFTLGLRVGELVALKKEDFSEKVVHIQRQEVKKYIHDESGAVKRDGYEGICLWSSNQWQNAGCERVQGCSNNLKIKKARKPWFIRLPHQIK